DTTPVGWGAEPGSADQVYLTFDLTNEAHAAVRLRSAGTSLRGLELVAAGRPVTLGSGETASITLRYRVTDCGQVPAEPAPIPLVLRTPLGLTRTVDGPDSLTQDQYGAPVPWTRDLLSHSC
ncbi:MAG TPA: hypothetical protein VGO78_13985, partial [Acidimicrobiales bacterium]|nr:hypothetical protein [Acidimicrobiales bacterium]